ncbi:MAG: hypothetical protein HYS98_08995 [Deltaproteobacteria bacterium]|nr:hypothetical protein [Deltaproteobacteria bacterium]
MRIFKSLLFVLFLVPFLTYSEGSASNSEGSASNNKKSRSIATKDYRYNKRDISTKQDTSKQSKKTDPFFTSDDPGDRPMVNDDPGDRPMMNGGGIEKQRAPASQKKLKEMNFNQDQSLKSWQDKS